ncbi:FAD-dependent oxidoreductase [Litorilituus sediminis]|uniref:FAD-dependent oxidoreductase n=1 Tax=Litorilituus sediminis TaxID=718192 RepID=A0A4P6P9N3_9GAMM|nr:FAD-dependent oxidoreductase [Litorilituus sediminis]QBG36999.1 FAD-dependent oxidoreductase [Litorilituus sediminis]
MTVKRVDTLIAGGGIAGLVTALELLQAGQQVCIVDRDTPQRIGGLARWAFGGMALCQTQEQQKMSIADNPSVLLKDWHSFAEFTADDFWPKAWAKEYADNNYQKVYLWLKDLGLSFLPAVNWVERGLYTPGNSMPRYHVLWGTGWHLIETILAKLAPYVATKKLHFLHQHKVVSSIIEQARVVGALIMDEKNQSDPFAMHCQDLVIACGGINGSTERVKANWCKAWGKAPESLLNGANPLSDGKLHDHLASIGSNLTRLDDMWNYAAGIKHPQAEFEGHGLSLIPCKSALWLDHSGKRIGPVPLVTGFDTNYMCQQVARQAKPWTWQILNWKIAAKELAVSGSQHNPAIRDKKFFTLLKELLLGNHRLVKQLVAESDDFVCADNLELLCQQMNAKTDASYIAYDTLANEVNHYDQQINSGLENDDQLRRIRHARQWRPDKLRTCKPKAILAKESEPLIAIRLQLISRKSLGGVQTNLSSQVLNQQGEVIEHLYCVGEAAGFGGGGASGKRSLEGTFLSGCILTAQNAAAAIIEAKSEANSQANKNN